MAKYNEAQEEYLEGLLRRGVPLPEILKLITDPPNRNRSAGVSPFTMSRKTIYNRAGKHRLKVVESAAERKQIAEAAVAASTETDPRNFPELIKDAALSIPDPDPPKKEKKTATQTAAGTSIAENPILMSEKTVYKEITKEVAAETLETFNELYAIGRFVAQNYSIYAANRGMEVHQYIELCVSFFEENQATIEEMSQQMEVLQNLTAQWQQLANTRVLRTRAITDIMALGVINGTPLSAEQMLQYTIALDEVL